jgi:cyclopropane fatty-acyl-phospholipid synthase-like methyltransferase
MRNPWLDIPLGDYEAHMALPAIGQSQLIADQLDILVRTHAPSSVAILGCAGGNGFERLIGTSVRVVGVDVNPQYIEEARQRYDGRVPGLKLLVADIQTSACLFEPVDFIYAALVFEYVDVARTMSVLRRHCKPKGILAVLSQVTHKTVPQVSPSPYTSLRLLEPGMHLLLHEELQGHATQIGFTPEDSRNILSHGGKQFTVETFRLCLNTPAGPGAV